MKAMPASGSCRYFLLTVDVPLNLLLLMMPVFYFRLNECTFDAKAQSSYLSIVCYRLNLA